MKYTNKKYAFSLMEVLVSIAIFIIILSIVIANYGYSQKVNELKLLAYDVEDSIRFVQNMSFTGQKINNQMPSNNGYGIIFKKSPYNSYLIYGDNASPGYLNSATDLEYSTASLPADIIFDYLSCKNTNGETEEIDPFDITFSAPRGSIEINGPNTYTLCVIQISSTKISGSWKINIIPSSTKIWTQFVN